MDSVHTTPLVQVGERGPRTLLCTLALHAAPEVDIHVKDRVAEVGSLVGEDQGEVGTPVTPAEGNCRAVPEVVNDRERSIWETSGRTSGSEARCTAVSGKDRHTKENELDRRHTSSVSEETGDTGVSHSQIHHREVSACDLGSATGDSLGRCHIADHPEGLR